MLSSRDGNFVSSSDVVVGTIANENCVPFLVDTTLASRVMSTHAFPAMLDMLANCVDGLNPLFDPFIELLYVIPDSVQPLSEISFTACPTWLPPSDGVCMRSFTELMVLPASDVRSNFIYVAL